jgi:hypothetical protein
MTSLLGSSEVLPNVLVFTTFGRGLPPQFLQATNALNRRHIILCSTFFDTNRGIPSYKQATSSISIASDHGDSALTPNLNIPQAIVVYFGL